MKSYIKSHIFSSIIMSALGLGGLHLLITGLRSTASSQQEISTIMQSHQQNAATVPTLGQIGLNLGGFFRNIG
ncbi:hypothetical protein [Acidithiobacillus sp.]|uniref:hypothetical protein n=1 Tax=Acidithiobacillus sp. TaxID=1872118 RepID=UPI002326C34A|nr:hypothetical protein [Acidithiobacillus sp.]MDA8246971.1 hypothetical protein [Acidithiobacillus sp.]